MARVYQKYEICYPNPLILKVGDRVTILREETNPQWPNWFYCKALDGNEGWISKKYLAATVGEVEIIETYNATEIAATIGEDLEQIKTENGWIWCRNSQGKEGWVPESIFKISSSINLIKAKPDFAEIFYQFRRDPITLKYNPLAQSNIDSLRDRLSKASSDLKEIESAESFFWLIESDSRILGHVTLQNINKTMLTGEIGYGIMPEARGLGVATAAIGLLTKKYLY